MTKENAFVPSSRDRPDLYDGYNGETRARSEMINPVKLPADVEKRINARAAKRAELKHKKLEELEAAALRNNVMFG